MYYYIYIMGSLSSTLYIGVTNNIHRRVFEHKQVHTDGFTKKYGCIRLLYYEHFDFITDALSREKQLKRWRREKKEWLIRIQNPTWVDLSSTWYE